jgi:hypothetical protein
MPLLLLLFDESQFLLLGFGTVGYLVTRDSTLGRRFYIRFASLSQICFDDEQQKSSVSVYHGVSKTCPNPSQYYKAWENFHDENKPD